MRNEPKGGAHLNIRSLDQQTASLRWKHGSSSVSIPYSSTPAAASSESKRSTDGWTASTATTIVHVSSTQLFSVSVYPSDVLAILHAVISTAVSIFSDLSNSSGLLHHRNADTTVKLYLVAYTRTFPVTRTCTSSTFSTPTARAATAASATAACCCQRDHSPNGRTAEHGSRHCRGSCKHGRLRHSEK